MDYREDLADFSEELDDLMADLEDIRDEPQFVLRSERHSLERSKFLLFRSTFRHTDDMFCCPAHFLILLDEFGCRSFAYRALFRSFITFMNITANAAYPFCHCNFLLK